MKLYAGYGVVLFGVLLIAGFLIARAERSPMVVARSLLAGAGPLVAVVVNQPIVHAVNEQRPFVQLPHVLLLVKHAADGSFPSDHATFAGAVAVGLLFVHRKVGIVAVAAAVLMAFARVYIGVHFPIDVLAGLAVGGIVAAAMQMLSGPLSRGIAHLGETRIAPVLLRS